VLPAVNQSIIMLLVLQIFATHFNPAPRLDMDNRKPLPTVLYCAQQLVVGRLHILIVQIQIVYLTVLAATSYLGWYVCSNALQIRNMLFLILL